MANSFHVNWLREGVRQWNKRRKKVRFRPDLSGLRFRDLLPPDFRDSPQTSRYFEGIDLRDANLSGADLSNLNFASAKFDQAIMVEASMSLTNFTNASFRGADLSYITAENSDFLRADFRGAKLGVARIRNNDFSQARLQETDVTVAQIRSNSTAAAFLTSSDWSIHKALNKAVRAIADPNVDALQEAKEKSKKHVVDVLYATNRLPILERGKLVDFSGDRGSEVRYGVCEVVIPDPSSIGKIGSRIWRIISGSQRETLRVSEVIDYSSDLFWQHWVQSFNRMSEKAEPVVFVHGFNNTFKQGVERAAKICSSLGLGQGIGLYSWPSKGSMHDYVADQNAVDASKLHFISFLEEFHAKHPAGKFNVIAHSMGCRLLISALEIMQIKGSPVLADISNVILVAADVDSGSMGVVGHPIANAVQRMTSYASDADLALFASGKIAAFPRIGYLPPVFILNGMDSIVVDGDDGTIIHHGYIEATRIIADIFYLIKAKLPPSSRHMLSQIVGSSGVYWRLK